MEKSFLKDKQTYALTDTDISYINDNCHDVMVITRNLKSDIVYEGEIFEQTTKNLDKGVYYTYIIPAVKQLKRAKDVLDGLRPKSNLISFYVNDFSDFNYESKVIVYNFKKGFEDCTIIEWDEEEKSFLSATGEGKEKAYRQISLLLENSFLLK